MGFMCSVWCLSGFVQGRKCVDFLNYSSRTNLTIFGFVSMDLYAVSLVMKGEIKKGVS